jgi:DUF971 family protein
VKAPRGATTTEITWGDGARCVYPNAILRGYCPCAHCQGHGGTIEFVPGGNAELRELDLLAVEFGNDLVLPMFVDQRKFFSERFRCHERSST